MKVIINNAEMVPTPKKGTIIRFGDCGSTAIDDVFKDCFIPTTTYEKGPLQFEIDEQLNTTWYKK